MKIIKIIEWDMGHRIPNHKSICKNIHGHRYKLEVCLEGKLITKRGISDEGMLLDFSDFKKILVKEVYDVCDHGFMLWNKDKVLVQFFKKNVHFKTILVDFIPTAELIAKWVYKKITPSFKKKWKNKISLMYVRIYETPTSMAEYHKHDYK